MRAIVAAIVLLAATTAEARIICRDGYQVVHGREISTPYCNDNYVAQIARKHGFKVSDSEIRNNPAKKNEVCRFISSNIEIRQYCNDADDKRSR